MNKLHTLLDVLLVFASAAVLVYGFEAGTQGALIFKVIAAAWCVVQFVAIVRGPHARMTPKQIQQHALASPGDRAALAVTAIAGVFMVLAGMRLS